MLDDIKKVVEIAQALYNQFEQMEACKEQGEKLRKRTESMVELLQKLKGSDVKNEGNCPPHH